MIAIDIYIYIYIYRQSGLPAPRQVPESRLPRHLQGRARATPGRGNRFSEGRPSGHDSRKEKT